MSLQWEEIQNILDSDSILITSSSTPDIPLHGHSFFELVYVLEGSVEQIKNGIKSILKQGDYFIVDYGVTHMYRKINNENFKILNFLFLPKLIDKSLGSHSSFKELVNNYLIKLSYKNIEEDPTNLIFHDDSNKMILNTITNIQTEHQNKRVGNLEIIRSYLIIIIITMMRRVTPADIITTDDSSKYIMDYLSNNYMDPIHLGDFCTVLNYSLPYLSKKFKNDTGMSFITYLQSIRIEQSCRLLANTNKKIDEIAMLVGYNDVPFFNTIFKKKLDMSPRAFRKMHRS